MSVPEWVGDIPTWIGAGGALGAAWFAYQTITSQRQQIGEQQAFIADQTRFMDEQRQNLELERAELRAQADERRISQAQKVHMGQHLVGGFYWRATVGNSSTSAVRNLNVRFGIADGPALVKLKTTGQVWETVSPPLQLLGPGRTALFESPQWDHDTAQLSKPTLFFTDDNGVRWSLDSYGKLEEVPADGAS
ncbi:hypothetical protein [Streptomyces sp. NPDC059402]|uniref:hypothetical protein n=1 Tax=unclassified Streptomyces TaxID=2593676 RepID=UPI00369D46EF